MFGRVESLYIVGAQLNMGVRDLSVPKVRILKMPCPGWLQTQVKITVIVLTDSQILISRLQEGKVRTTWVAPLDNIRAALTIVYSPGHAGISYNELPSC